MGRGNAFARNKPPAADRIKSAAQILKAVAHPVRLRILLALRRRQPMSVREIQTAVQAPQSTVSQHLAVMRRLGVLADERRANSMLYRIKNANIFKLLDCVNRLSQEEGA